MKHSQLILTTIIPFALLAGCGGGSSKSSTDTGTPPSATDTTAPVRSNAKPNSTLVLGTTATTLSLSTNENASCKYSTTSNQSYDQMSHSFTTTGGKNHSQQITGLTHGIVYSYYVRCMDVADNKNTNDFIVAFSVGSTGSSGGFVIGHTHTGLSNIPDSWIAKAKTDLHIAYNHTSHGSQLITGMNALKSYPAFADKYNWVNDSQGNNQALSLDDRGIPGVADLSQGNHDDDSDNIANWAEATYSFLDNPANNHINVIMWSWCNIGGYDMNLYLNSMEGLIQQFGEGGTHARAAAHPVKFIFMTGHANGGGENDSSDTPNKLIRQHVATHDRILFDFSDIENYDPDGYYFLDKNLNDALDYSSNGTGSRDTNWAAEYLASHDNSELDKLTHGEGITGYNGARSCAHSNASNNDARLNCVLKGRGVWHLFARLAGWDGQ